ncbi:MAG: FtsX-like permease family protein [Cyclobacteriaceae bacterium]
MTYRKIPKWARGLLQFLVSKEDYEFMVGDVEELYNQRRRKSGVAKSKLYLLKDLISEIRLAKSIKRRVGPQSDLGLVSNYLKLGLRSFMKHKTFSFGSLIILTLGFICVFMIAKFVQYEFSFDKNGVETENVYRVYRQVNEATGFRQLCNVPAPLGPAISEGIPEVTNIARICKFREEGTYALSEVEVFKEPGYLWADNNLLHVMGYEMISGNLETALSESGSVVLTRTAARKYFGEDEALGKVIIFKTLFHQDVPLTVTGVIENPLPNSHLQFDILNSFETLASQHFETIIDSWEINYYFTYLELKATSFPAEVEMKMDELMANHIDEEKSAESAMKLQPISEIYLNPNDTGRELGPTSDIRYSYFISAVGLLILIMSSINYTNLATVKSLGRAKEIGIRKAIGASRRGVFLQNIVESQILSLLALVLALGVVYSVIPLANESFDRSMSIDLLADWYLLLGIGAAAVLVGLISGFYPAVILAALRPVVVLRSGSLSSAKSTNVRKFLIITQFVASSLILFSSTIVYQQMDYVVNSDLGFDAEHLLIMPLSTAETVEKFQLLKDKLEAEPEVFGFAAASQYAGSPQLFGEDFDVINPQTGEVVSVPSLRFAVSHDFLKVLGARFLAGRNFNKSFSSEENRSVIINQAFLRGVAIDDPTQIIGKELTVDFNWGERLILNVVGVIEDFKMESFRAEVEPAVFYIRPSEFYFAHLRVDGQNIRRSLEKIEAITREIAPKIPYNVFFQNDRINQLYKSDKQFQQVLFYFTVLAIVIACLGLFSFSLYMIRQKTKEIGIRKVLGASTGNITRKLVMSFVGLVGVSLIVSLPAAHLMTKGWLDGFSYRISPSIYTYVLVSAALLLLTMLTVFFHSTRAARRNPVETLRTD